MAIPNLAGKTVVVTGAGSGIGRATALAFARRGAQLVAADLNAEPLQALQRELGAHCLTAVVDVADAAAMQAFAERVRHAAGVPHVLVNNAGVGYLGRFLDSDLAHWQRVLDVNLMGVVHGCHAFLPMMIAAGGPRQVLNVASSAANYPSPTMAAYAASKYAVAGLSEVLKMELAGTGVGVATICPGVVNTPIAQARRNTGPAVTQAQLDKLQAYYASKGCPPELVAEAMVRAAQRGDDIVLVGPYAQLIYHARRVSLRLVRRLMLDGARKSGYL